VVAGVWNVAGEGLVGGRVEGQGGAAVSPMVFSIEPLFFINPIQAISEHIWRG
jgi:hypothetical protein